MNNFTLKLIAIFLFATVFQAHAQIVSGSKYTLKNKGTGKYLSSQNDNPSTPTNDAWVYLPVETLAGNYTAFLFTAEGNMFTIEGTRGLMVMKDTSFGQSTTKANAATINSDRKLTVEKVSGTTSDYLIYNSNYTPNPYLTEKSDGTYYGQSQDGDRSVWTIEVAVLSNDKLDDSSVFMSNPVKDNVFITGLTAEINQIHVYSLLGAKVLSQEVNNAASLQMNVSGLSKGMYIVDFVGENGNFTKKLIKE